MPSRVEWVEIHIPPTDILESYIVDGAEMPPFPSTRYRGEVLGVIRVWGETRLLVLLDSGGTREVNAKLAVTAE